MKLAYWMYAGPAHIGVLRVSSSFKNVHAIMHAPLGDDYFNVMRSMLERERDFTPVTASIVDRHVLARGSQEKVVENITRKNKEEAPDLILLTPTCTSSILQEDLHNFVERSTEAMPTRSTSGKSKELKVHVDDAPISNFGNANVSKNFVSFGPNSLLPEGHTSTIINQGSTPPLSSFVGLAGAEGTEIQPDVILADVNHYRVNELQAADRTLEQIVRYYIEKAKKQNCLITTKTEKPSVNIIGIFTLGFHNQHDCRELKRLFNDLGIKINEIIPEGGNVHNLKNLPQAWFNFVPYREVGLMTANYLKTEFDMPYVSITPMGLIDTAACIRAIGKIISNVLQTSNDVSLIPKMNLPFGANVGAEAPSLNVPKAGPKANRSAAEGTDIRKINMPNSTNVASATLEHLQSNNPLKKEKGELAHAKKTSWVLGFSVPPAPPSSDSLIENLFNKYIDQQTRFVSQAAWFSRSIDCQNLTGKKAVVFGDATHSAAMTKILAREMGIRVSCAGTYCKHDADWFREQVSGFCDQILITDDHNLIKETIAKLEPAAIFGTQMERHVGKRLDIPCGVISAPVHIQNFPLGYRPFLGYEGTNQIADLVYNSFNLGMEDHLLQIFGGHDSVINTASVSTPSVGGNSIKDTTQTDQHLWSPDGLAELNKVPGFVRGKVKRNTEKYALQNNISVITVEVMYAAKEALSN